MAAAVATLGGPQEERSRRFLQSNSDLGIVDKREVVLPIDFQTQEQAYTRRLNQLGEENEFLKGYVERVLGELKRVLIKHGQVDELRKDLAIEQENEGTSPPWFTSEEYMNPLLAAYDLRLKEMEGTCESTRQEFRAIEGKAEAIAAENEQLHAYATVSFTH